MGMCCFFFLIVFNFFFGKLVHSTYVDILFILQSEKIFTIYIYIYDIDVDRFFLLVFENGNVFIESTFNKVESDH